MQDVLNRVVFFDITFVACAASLIESPGLARRNVMKAARGGRNIAPAFKPG